MCDSFEKRDQYKKPNSKMLELRLTLNYFSLVCEANRWEKIQSQSVQFQVEHSGTNSMNSPTPISVHIIIGLYLHINLIECC